MSQITRLLDNLAPYALVILLLGSATILGTAYIFQSLGYAPCELCYYQRYPYMVVIGLSGIAVAMIRANKKNAALLQTILLLCVLLLFIDAGIAGYHAGVEYKWWEGPTACTALTQFSGTTEERLAQLMNAPLIRCDVAAWTLFGISMAGYNFFLALGLGSFGLRSWLKGRNA